MESPTERSNLNEAPGSAATRRKVIRSAFLGMAAGLTVTVSGARAQTAADAQPERNGRTVFRDDQQPVPLPFSPSSLKGLSARLMESHWTNNYGGSVRALNEVNKRLSLALDQPDLPAYVYNDLKREHLMRTGSVVLHELYFANLGSDRGAPAALRSDISASFGSFDRWETEFRRIAAGLSGGSGWVMLGFNRHLRVLENYWMADHMHGPVTAEPLLVLDMYEHSYHMDYGAAAARYVDAFFDNINWDVVASRYDAAG